MDTLTSPDQFDRYIKIMNPKIWVMLAAMIIVLLNLLAWTFFQNQVVRISTVGMHSRYCVTAYCFRQMKR